jgi:hypothetical protein
METEKKCIPKIFISYSWSTQEHQNWVIELAEKLMANGVSVIIDVWDFKEGQDKFSFMEKMVTDSQVSKVLIICDKAYASKADRRSGGVGTETQIISAELYDKVVQTKFIPVVVEHENGHACVPTFIKSRKYIDLSDNASGGNDFETLLRAIFDRPLHRKPPIGKKPSFLDVDENFIGTSGKYYLLKESIEKEKANIKPLLKDFVDEAIEVIKLEYISKFQSDDHDEEILASIAKLKPLKDQFCNVVDYLCRYNLDDSLRDLNLFFENLIPYMNHKGVGQYFKYQFDNIRFIAEELFLSKMAILLKNQKFESAHDFINTSFLSRSSSNGLSNVRFDKFQSSIESLNTIRKNKLKSNRISLSYDLMKERSESTKGITFDNICEADFILWFNAISSKNRLHWFPGTLAFIDEYSPNLEIFVRAESKKFFEKFKIVLNVDSLDDLKLKFNEIISNNDLSRWRYPNAWGALPLEACLNLERLASV